MGDANLSAPRGDRTADNFIDPQQVESDGGGGDVHDRIDRADFVKVNLLDRGAVDGRLGLRHRAEDPQCQVALIVGQSVGLVDDPLDVGQVAMCVLFGVLHTEMLGAEAAAHDFVQVDRHARQVEGLDSRADRGGIDPRIDQGGDRHVTADSRGTVQISNAHVEFLGL